MAETDTPPANIPDPGAFKWGEDFAASIQKTFAGMGDAAGGMVQNSNPNNDEFKSYKFQHPELKNIFDQFQTLYVQTQQFLKQHPRKDASKIESLLNDACYRVITIDSGWDKLPPVAQRTMLPLMQEIVDNYKAGLAAAIQKANAAPGTPAEAPPTSAPTGDDQDPTKKKNPLSGIGDWFKGIGFGGILGLALGGVFAFLVGSAFGGGGIFSMVISLILAIPFAIIGSKAGQSFGGAGHDAGVPAGPGAGAAGPAQPVAYRSPEMNGPGQATAAEQVYYGGYYDNHRMAFANSTVTGSYTAGYVPPAQTGLPTTGAPRTNGGTISLG